MTTPRVTGPPLLDAVPGADSLTPVRDALLRLARRDAGEVLAAADAETAAVVGRADDEAERIRATAREQAASDAEALRAAEQGRAQREARAIELRARRAAYDELVSRARDAVRNVAREPGIQEALVALARAGLGADATITPTPDGGVLAEAAGRSMRYELPALVDQAVAELVSLRECSP